MVATAIAWRRRPHQSDPSDLLIIVSLFKDTSVAFAISVWELATAYRELANASGQFLLLGLAVSAFYLAMSLPMAHLARLLEQRLRNRSTERVVEQEAVA